MKNTYAYQLPFNNNLWKIIGFFLLVTLFGKFIPFQIHTSKYNLSNNVLFLGGLLFSFIFLLVAVILKQKSNNSKLNPNQLELTDTYLQFPIGKDEKVQAQYYDIESAQQIGNKMNGSILQIKSKSNSFATIYVYAKGFSSINDYNNFEDELIKNIN